MTHIYHFQAFSEKITWGEKTDWVGKKLTSQIFPILSPGKKLTGEKTDRYNGSLT